MEKFMCIIYKIMTSSYRLGDLVLLELNETEKEEILLIDFAINTIKADDKIEYSEIKFCFPFIAYRKINGLRIKSSTTSRSIVCTK